MAIKVLSFTGNNGVGAISISGLLIGDKIISVIITSPSISNDVSGLFAPFIISDDELFQTSSSNQSANTFTVLIERKVIIP